MDKQHIQMAFTDRNVTRLAGDKTAVMQAGQHVGQLDQLLEGFDVALASPALQITHKGRAVDRGKHLRGAADFNRAITVASQLGEFARGLGAQRSEHLRVGFYPRALHIGPAAFPDFQCFRIIAVFNPDVFQQPAVCQSIRRLEAAIGIMLFKRNHRIIALTDAGEVLKGDVSPRA